MKSLFGLFMLLSLLVLTACSDTTPELGNAPDDAGTIANFRFDIDPSGEQVGVTAPYRQEPFTHFRFNL